MATSKPKTTAKTVKPETVAIELPAHLYNAIRTKAEEVSVTPSQFIAALLAFYQDMK